MKKVARRPKGVALAAVLVAINGIASLVEAFEVAEFTTAGLLEAIVSAVIGLALLHRAYGLWNLRRMAWLITLVLLCLKVVVGLFWLLTATSSTAAWINLILVVAAILYLVQPEVRKAFSDNQAGT